MAKTEIERKIGDTGSYESIAKPGPFKDGMDAHHMPSQKYLKDHDMDTDQGFSALMDRPQHRQTRTYAGKAIKLDTSGSYRSEIGKDLADYVKILKENGSWTPQIRQSLMKGLDNFKKEFPDLFRKVNQ
jgi:hypothetical protein